MSTRRVVAVGCAVVLTLLVGASWFAYTLGYYHAIRGGIAQNSSVDEAIGYFLTAYEKNPDAFMVAHDLACCYALKGDDDACFKWLSRALSSSYGDYAKETARTESDFDSVRTSDRFQELIFDQ